MNVPIAQRNTFHKPGKLILGVLSIIAAITLIMLLVGLRTGLYATITAFVDNLGADIVVAQSGVKGLYSSDSSVPFEVHDVIGSEIEAVDGGHILVSDIIFTHAEIKTPVILIGYEPEGNFGNPWKLGEGRFIEHSGEILLDTWLASRSQLGVGDQISMLGKNFEIVGLTLGTSSWMSPYIFISLSDAEEVLGISGIVSYHLFNLPNFLNGSEAKELINSNFDNLEALTPEEIATTDRRVVATIMDLPIIVLLVISVVIGTAVMGLTAYTSISDRLREYGVLKAIGASQAQLIRIVVLETLYQAGLGYLLAIGVSIGAARIIMFIYPQFNILIETKVVLQAGLLTFLMTMISALFPIQKLRRIDPILVFKS